MILVGKTEMLGIWVCRVELSHSINIVPNYGTATCSFSLSSVSAKPSSREVVQLEKILIVPL